MRAGALIVVYAAAVGCRCATPVQSVAPPSARLSPPVSTFPDTFLGSTSTRKIRIDNVGDLEGTFALHLSGAFSAESTLVTVPGLGAVEVEVSFAPTIVGVTEGAISIDEFAVALRGTGLEVPACPSSSCSVATFDTRLEACVFHVRADDEPCSDACLIEARCHAGRCEGRARDCGDGDPCTVDGCGADGACVHSEVTCEAPRDPCQAARCDVSRGCVVEVVPDGTLCGPDDCLATHLSVCISGQCVNRARPSTGRCSNTWVPTQVPARRDHVMAYDHARRQTVLFGGRGRISGLLSDTWEWNGVEWSRRSPAVSPSPRTSSAMVYDSSRRRLVLFGGAGSSDLSDTWDWDGTNWVERHPLRSPSGRSSHAMAYDGARQRVVMFGGQRGATALRDTWEWDGTTWLELPTADSPSLALSSMAYDAMSRRTILFGVATGRNELQTWSWDGRRWLLRASEPGTSFASIFYDANLQRVRRIDRLGQLSVWEWNDPTWTLVRALAPLDGVHSFAVAPDVDRRRTVLFGGEGAWGVESTTLELDEALRLTTTTQGPAPASVGSMAYDSARRHVIAVNQYSPGSLDLATWAWNGSSWTSNGATDAPQTRFTVMTYDLARRRLVLFGGRSSPFQWEHDAVSWSSFQPVVGPLPRDLAAMAYDRTRQRVVLFGGRSDSGATDETWERDSSAAWVAIRPSQSPPARVGAAMVEDPRGHRVVLVGGLGDGGQPLADTWAWDGASWTRLQTVSAPSGAFRQLMAYDSARQRIVLFGGLSTDTWAFDGVTWTNLRPTHSPPSGLGAMAYDEDRDQLVFASGSDTWVYLP